MNTELLNILGECWQRFITPKEAHDKILSLKAESEIVASDSRAVKHHALHGVRNLECEADRTEDVENTNDAALETRIDSKEDCHHPFEERVYYLNDFYCNYCKQLLTYDNLVES